MNRAVSDSEQTVNRTVPVTLMMLTFTLTLTDTDDNDDDDDKTMTMRPCVRTQRWVRTKQGKSSVLRAPCGVLEWASPEHPCWEFEERNVLELDLQTKRQWHRGLAAGSGVCRKHCKRWACVQTCQNWKGLQLRGLFVLGWSSWVQKTRVWFLQSHQQGG